MKGLTYYHSGFTAIALLVVGSLSLMGSAAANTPINRATVRSLRNTVQLIQPDRGSRPAKVKDAMTPGDAVETARASMVELQFNDRSLARIGERALFQFLPETRTFRLANGTALLLIPPGQGTTRLKTPNAAAGIRGSALFVRYIPETSTTIVGALTNSGIEIVNGDQSQRQPIAAGQLAVIVKDRIERIYNFDLKTFYETSPLVQGLELQSRKNLAGEPDAAIAAVREETLQAIETQDTTRNTASTPLANPGFLRQTSRLTDPAAPSGSLPGTQLPPAPVGMGGPGWFNPINSPLFSAPINPVVTTSPTQIFPGGKLPDQSPDAPGRSGSAPGQFVTNPGRGNGGPPGQSGSTPDRGNANPPGQSVTNPGRGNGGPPGQSGTAPGS